ncbi:hypothetical protein FACS189499_04000 [Clostridia bacterium]|nr:hypothetical protein FACS189499_04000 [Clostridia bacterium]
MGNLPFVKNTQFADVITAIASKTKSLNQSRVVIVATTAAGYAAKDCDYLCTGENDQVVINAAITANQGKRIALLDGTYVLGGAVTVSGNGTVLEGQGAATIITPSNVSGTSIISIYNTGCKLKNLDIVIDDLNNSITNQYISIQGGNASEKPVVENVAITSNIDLSITTPPQYAITSNTNTNGVVLKNLTLTGNFARGIHFSNSSNIFIENLKINIQGGVGVLLYNDANTQTINSEITVVSNETAHAEAIWAQSGSNHSIINTKLNATSTVETAPARCFRSENSSGTNVSNCEFTAVNNAPAASVVTAGFYNYNNAANYKAILQNNKFNILPTGDTGNASAIVLAGSCSGVISMNDFFATKDAGGHELQTTEANIPVILPGSLTSYGTTPNGKIIAGINLTSY